MNKKILNKTNNKFRGFTLVELIVVIAIVGVLASILVPNMISYVKKAKCQAAIADAKTIVTGVQASLIDKTLYGSLHVDKKARLDGVDTKVGGLTNTAICNAYDSKSSTNADDRAIAAAVREILANAGIDSGTKPTAKPWGLTGKKFLETTTANYGLVIIYTSAGEVPFMQIYHNGILVTYAYGEYVANDSSSATFISLNSYSTWDKLFTAAGVDESDIDDSLRNSYISSWG